MERRAIHPAAQLPARRGPGACHLEGQTHARASQPATRPAQPLKARETDAHAPGSSSRAAGTPDSVVRLADQLRRRQGGGQTAKPRQGGRRQQPPARRSGEGMSDRDLLAFERQGHLVTRALLTQQEMEGIKQVLEAEVEQRRLQALQHRARVLCAPLHSKRPRTVAEAERLLGEEGVEPVGFLQFFNTWRTSAAIRELVTGGALPRAAAQLLGTGRLRLYQDCTFLKAPGYAETNWHSDARMAPFDTSSLVTAWLPLRPVAAAGDSGMRYASGSHRDFALPFWRRGRLEGLDLRARGYPLAGTGALQLGYAAWHHGWTLHAAGAQPPASRPRLALSVSYFADGVRVLPRSLAGRVQDEDAESYAEWLGEVRPGAAAEHALLPLIEVA